MNFPKMMICMVLAPGYTGLGAMAMDSVPTDIATPYLAVRNPVNVQALCEQAAVGNEVACSFLLEAGAHIHTRNSKGFTALMLAAMSGHLDLFKLFKAHGAYLTQLDKQSIVFLVPTEILKLLGVEEAEPHRTLRKLSGMETFLD